MISKETAEKVLKLYKDIEHLQQRLVMLNDAKTVTISIRTSKNTNVDLTYRTEEYVKLYVQDLYKRTELKIAEYKRTLNQLS